MTLPLDLDIFLRSGSRIQPLIEACFHGSWSWARWERTMVENSQVRMMSWPCGRTSIGYTFSKRSSSAPQPPASCGVREEVAQVSRMSGSEVEPRGRVGGDSGDRSLGRARGMVGRRVED